MDSRTARTTVLNLSNLSTGLKQVRLADEARNLLFRVGGKVQVEFDPNASDPIIRIVDQRGKPLCTVSDFEKLATYRRFLADAVKKAEDSDAADLGLARVAKLLNFYEATVKEEPPEIISQENRSKQVEVEQLLKRVRSNIGLIEKLPNDQEDFRTYLLNVGDKLEAILVGELIASIGPEKLTKDRRLDQMILAGVPVWLYGKFISGDWIKPETKSSKSLLFPKNNFLKGLALQTRELLDHDFVMINHLVMKYSHHLPYLIKTSLVDHFRPESTDSNSEEQLEKAFQEHKWTLHWGGQVEEIFQPRLEGKAPPVIFLEKARTRESELPRLKRKMRNDLTKLNQNLLMLMHGLILTEDNLGQFWAQVYPGARNWELTPAKDLYDYIKEEDPNLVKFGKIVNLENNVHNEMLYEILLMKLEIYDKILKSGFMIELKKLKPMAEPRGFDKNKTAIIPCAYRMGDVSDIKIVSDADKDKARTFLQIHDKKKVMKKTRANARVINPKVKKALGKLKSLRYGDFLINQVENWLATSFTTANDQVISIAVDLILAGAFREEILVEDFDEYSESEKSSDSESE